MGASERKGHSIGEPWRLVGSAINAAKFDVSNWRRSRVCAQVEVRTCLLPHEVAVARGRLVRPDL